LNARAATFRVDRRALARAFGRAGERYDAAAALQATVREELLTRLDYFKLAPKVVLDLGCGTARGAVALRARFRHARVLGVDLAPGMLQAARQQTRSWLTPPWRRLPLLCADACALPIANGSVDLIYSNLMLQWCDDLPRVFAELQRVLRPGGLLLFSSFGSETLQELRGAWADTDQAPHVNLFTDMPGLGQALGLAGFAEPVLDRELLLEHQPSVPALMAALRAIGAGNALADRRRTLTGPARVRAMQARYEALRQPAGLPVTWELLYGAAFAGAARPGQQAAGAPGEYHVPLSALRPRGAARP
jgi:malonyl-CoA O-methyltransferase